MTRFGKLRIIDHSGSLIEICGPWEKILNEGRELMSALKDVDLGGEKVWHTSGYDDNSEQSFKVVWVPLERVSWFEVVEFYGRK